jgi:O-antigen/teichoic acid export membrane protein
MSDDSDGFVGLLLGSGMFVFFGWIIDRAVRFGARLAIARGFGKVDYGAVSLGATVLAMGSTFALLGLHVGVSRYLPRDESAAFKRGIILSGAQIILPAALVVGGIVVIFAEPLAVTLLKSKEQAYLLRIFGFGIPFATTVKFAINVVRGQQSSEAKIILQNITIPVLQFTGIAIAYAGTFGRIGIAWAYTASYVLATLLSLYYMKKHTPLFRRIKPTYLHKELFSFSIPLLFTSVMFMILTDIDTAMLGYFNTPSEIAEYNVAYPISFLLLVFLESFAFLFIPILSELHSDEKFRRMRSIYQLLTKWVIFLTIPLFLLIISYPHRIIELTFGKEYLVASTTMIILSCGFFVRAVAGPNGATLIAIGRTRLHAYYTAVATILNILLNLILIPRFSYLGAAVATAISYVLLNALYSYQVYIVTGILPVSRRTLRPLVGITIISSIAYVVSEIPSSLWAFLALFTGYIVAFVGVIVVFGGITSEERLLLDSIEERLGIDLSVIKRLVS